MKPILLINIKIYSFKNLHHRCIVTLCFLNYATDFLNNTPPISKTFVFYTMGITIQNNNTFFWIMRLIAYSKSIDTIFLCASKSRNRIYQHSRIIWFIIEIVHLCHYITWQFYAHIIYTMCCSCLTRSACIERKRQEK